jgi:hypothetical protein
MTTTAAERKAAERINRQVAPWRYRAELDHAAGRALAYEDAIKRDRKAQACSDLR